MVGTIAMKILYPLQQRLLRFPDSATLQLTTVLPVRPQGSDVVRKLSQGEIIK